jgi:hypothetical protein
VGKPPSWNEIRARAQSFATDWAGETAERAEAQTFWNEFLSIFGVSRRRVAKFEASAKRTSTGGQGSIDLLWPGILIAEHKSAGKDLQHAEEQALDYLDSIGDDAFPGVVITSDFAHFRIRDLGGDNIPYTFEIEQLPNEIERFAFIAGYQKRQFGDEVEVEANITAAKLMARLYEQLSSNGLEGHEASILLTRVLLLMFGDDTGMWERNLFGEFLDTRTSADGSDLGPQLAFLFQVLDKPEDARSPNTDEILLRFPYVNGGLFAERLDIPTFNKRMRDALVDCCKFDWGSISPAVFGSLFQAIKSREARRELGEHYTTETNILRLLGPLFLDELRAEYESVKHNKQKLDRLQDRIADIKVFDPACGCGNFLIIAYRELRRLELDILVQRAALTGKTGQGQLEATSFSKVKLDHFFGIEMEEWPARIAETGMFLVDQQANHELARRFGQAPDRLPITMSATITVGNAIRTDWDDVLPASECTYIVGNPPFIGMSLLSNEQQEDNRLAFANHDGKRTGRLDYVACWYAKALDYMRGTRIRAAFVSTSSITQGEQARELGPLLVSGGAKIDFAHRTFAWSSESPGAAAVHVVIIGFSANSVEASKHIYEYHDIKGDPHELDASSINIYLADSTVPSIGKHTSPIVPNPKLTEGNKPQDGGGLIIEAEDLDEVLSDPIASKFVRRLVTAHGMLHNENRSCLWLIDATPAELRTSNVLRSRLEKVAESRLASPTAAAREKAKTPALFLAMRQPTGKWIAVPAHSSENRRIVPMAFYGPEDISHNSLMTIDSSDEYLFGILQSAMFTAWVSTVSGRLESRIRISADIAYNAFPFPASPSKEMLVRVVGAVGEVLDARKKYPESTLADLYDPLATPQDLVIAHDRLDAAVDLIYTRKHLSSESERLDILFTRYHELTAIDLFSTSPEPKRRKK